jgi:succinylarginine dihydrolase
MRNGGGPACLRLRVVLTPDELQAVHQPCLMTHERIDTLQNVVRTTYRDRLSPSDLNDPNFADECRTAREALLAALDLKGLS